MDGWRSLRPPESFFVARRRQDRPSGASTVLTASDDDAGWPTTCTPVPCRTRVPTGLVDVLPPLPLRPSSLPPPASWSPPQSRHRDHDPLAMSPASLTYAHGNHHVSLIVYSAEVMLSSTLFIFIHAEHVVHRRGYCFHFGCTVCMFVCLYVCMLAL